MKKGKIFLAKISTLNDNFYSFPYLRPTLQAHSVVPSSPFCLTFDFAASIPGFSSKKTFFCLLLFHYVL